MLRFTPNASFSASSAGYKFFAQTGGNRSNNDAVVLDGAGGWGILKPPLIQRRLTTWWWQCWFYACLPLIDLWARGNRKQSASPILNSTGCEPSRSLGIDHLEGMWSREGGKGEGHWSVQVDQVDGLLGCVCMGGWWAGLETGCLLMSLEWLSLIIHSFTKVVPLLWNVCVFVCSRLMYCDLTPAFIKH